MKCKNACEFSLCTYSCVYNQSRKKVHKCCSIPGAASVSHTNVAATNVFIYIGKN